MLASKYLTQDGIREMLQHIYDNGFKYIYHDTESDSFVASQQKPVFENEAFAYCMGFKKDISDGFAYRVLSDLLCEYYCIDIAEELNIVDWSTVKVDTPIFVSDRMNGAYAKRHFAKYENGIIYAYSNGYTSWSTPSEEDITEWNYGKLAE